MNANLLKNRTGDTIVEVLIAVTVVGLSIGLAYGVANRSLKSSRQSQERTEAVKLAEGQTEQLKALSYKDSSNDQGIFNNPNQTFCLNNGTKTTSTVTLGDLDSDNLSDYASECVKDLYHIGVVYRGAGSNTFDVYIRWFGIAGLDKEEVKITYRLFTE